jgi:hypothetical protein
MRNASLIGTVLILGLATALIRAAEPQIFASDDDGFIRNWLALPPIALNADVSAHTEASEQPLFAKEYFPNQNTVTPAAGDKVTVAGQELTWKAVACAVPWTFAETTENALFLALAYLVCDADLPDLTLAIGSDDSSLWRVNGQEVIRVYAGRGVDRDQNKSPPLTLKQGVNVLSAAVINGLGPAGLCARFLDKDGQPVKGLKVTLTPPPPPAPKP